MIRPPPISTLFPYTTLFRSLLQRGRRLPADRHGTARMALRDRTLGPPHGPRPHRRAEPERDRKSTRLNSSHPSISYAVFCLKKKKKNKHNNRKTNYRQ